MEEQKEIDTRSPARRNSRKIDHTQDMDIQPKSKPPSTTTIGVLHYGEHKDSFRQFKVRNFYGTHENQVFSVRYEQEDALVASATSDGYIQIFDISQNRVVHSLHGYSGSNQTPTTCLRWRPPVHSTSQHILVSVNSDGTISHWHAPSGKMLHQIVLKDNCLLCVDYNLFGSNFAVAGKDFHVRVYDDDTQSVIVDFQPADWNNPGHSNRVFAVKFLPEDPNVLISCAWDSNMLLWDMREKRSVGVIYGPNLSGDALDFQNNVILTGSYRNKDQLQLWDFQTRQLLENVNWNGEVNTDNAYVYTAQFAQKEGMSFLAGCSGVNELKMFDNDQGAYRPVASIIDNHAGIYSVDFNNQGSGFAFGGGQGITYMINSSIEVKTEVQKD